MSVPAITQLQNIKATFHPVLSWSVTPLYVATVANVAKIIFFVYLACISPQTYLVSDQILAAAFVVISVFFLVRCDQIGGDVDKVIDQESSSEKLLKGAIAALNVFADRFGKPVNSPEEIPSAINSLGGLLSKPSEESAAVIDRLRKDREKIEEENAALRAENERLKLASKPRDKAEDEVYLYDHPLFEPAVREVRKLAEELENSEPSNDASTKERESYKSVLDRVLMGKEIFDGVYGDKSLLEKPPFIKDEHFADASSGADS